MKAVRLYEGPEVRVEDVLEPEVGPGQIRVAVEAAGLCGTDLHAARGHLPVPGLPVIMGHEGAGIVEAVGAGVSEFGAGDRVLILPSETCGNCPACQDGHLGLCPAARIFGMARDGTFAEKIAVPASCALPLPDGIAFEHGAILADAVATAYHAVATRAGITGGERIAVLGCGGVGHHAILLARLLGAKTIVAADASPGSLRRAEEAGADATVDVSSGNARKAIREAAGGGGPDLVIEYVGKKASVELAMASVARGGRVIVGGVGMESPALGPLVSFVGREIGVLGSMGYTRAELDRVVELTATGRLDLSGSITARYPLDRAAEALDDLENRRNDPVRLALLPGASS
ncbi:MAG: alcohol dehydrogenase catalytic domain-containing protein [Deltaproteobacteria bacterium]|nr:alcohol dehydrogenase catalytic domain-containing protein [Deltaproteobacteria bacterium]MBW2445529.1 alcohol dehydrogenase catalytic domain-containing protein [Deltaproteobacteria bacterium]